MARLLPRSGCAIILATAAFTLSTAQAETLILSGPSTGGSAMRSDNPASVGNSVQMIVGQFGSSDRRGRALFSFDLSGIPQGAIIQSVSLVLTLDASDSGSAAGLVPLELYQLVGGGFDETSASWAKRDSETSWTTPGGDFGPTLLSTAMADPRGAVGDLFTFGSSAAFMDSVESNIGGTVSFLVKLNATDEANAATRHTFFIASDDSNTPERAPVFTVQYIPEPGSPVLLLAGAALAQAFRWRRRNDAV